MKRKLLSVILLAALLISLVIPAGTQAAEIKLNKKKVVLEVDAKITLKLGDVKATDVKWSSSAKKVATVTSKGVVTAKAEGSATITATYKKKKYTCKVTVVDSNKALFSTVQEYIDAQKDDIDASIASMEGSGMSMEIFADGDTLVYRYVYDLKVPVTKAVKKQFEENLALYEQQFYSVVDEMCEFIDVENPKVKLIYENPDGATVYEHTFAR